MKILHIIQSLESGGIENLVLSMLKEDMNNTFVLAIDGSAEKSIRVWPILTQFHSNLFFANKAKGFQKSVIGFIEKICTEQSITVIHTHSIGPLIYASLVRFYIKNLVHIHTQHDIWHLRAWKPWLFQSLILKFNPSIKLVAVSQTIFDGLKHYFPKRSITLIHNGIDTERFVLGDKSLARTALNFPLNATIIGHAGRLVPVKGQRFLIEAMLYLPQSFCLVIAGTGALSSELLQRIHELDLRQRIIMLGHMDDLCLFYQACDVFCLPSLDEGLPLVLLEAQACGLPVVYTNVGGTAEAVDPISSMMVEAKNSMMIAEACLTLSLQKTNPRPFILKNFSLQMLMEKYRQLYSRAL